MPRTRLLTLAALLFAAVQLTAAETSAFRLWYQQPAEKWTEALPIGNGRMGAMVFGGTTDERIQFNEDTLWTGKPRTTMSAPAPVISSPEIRRLSPPARSRKPPPLPKAIS